MGLESGWGRACAAAWRRRGVLRAAAARRRAGRMGRVAGSAPTRGSRVTRGSVRVRVRVKAKVRIRVRVKAKVRVRVRRPGVE